ncbi:hypothetical protein JCM11251_001647 [Rhodosporidiobolus azoricus]
MLRFTLLSAVFAAAAVRASVVSTSVFPNSACSGAGSALSGLVGVGQVKLANGNVELHCGCPTDGLDNFEICPSTASGEAVCNSVLDLESGAFTASCGTVTCSGADCPSTVVNTVVVDEDDCYNSEKGSIGITVVDGEAKCSCASEALAGEFSACPSPANGRATCRSIDTDFLGVSVEHQEKVACGVVCDEGYFLSPGGSCVHLGKRDVAGPSGGFHPGGPGKVGPSPSKHWYPSTKTPIKVGPSPTTKPHGHGHGSTTKPHGHGHGSTTKPHGGETTTSRHPHQAHPPSETTHSATTTTSPYKHHHHTTHKPSSHPSSRPDWQHPPTLEPSAAVPITTTTPGFSSHTRGPIKVGPSQVARRAAQEFVFTDVCAQDERTCPAGDFGDFSCVRLDDVTECGGCSSTGESKNCLEITGASSVACLRGGCVVRSCQTGYVQTSEGTCELKA